MLRDPEGKGEESKSRAPFRPPARTEGRLGPVSRSSRSGSWAAPSGRRWWLRRPQLTTCPGAATPSSTPPRSVFGLCVTAVQGPAPTRPRRTASNSGAPAASGSGERSRHRPSAALDRGVRAAGVRELLAAGGSCVPCSARPGWNAPRVF